ncbi:MAG: universal stress protein [Gammaproteobacteria bacterium]
MIVLNNIFVVIDPTRQKQRALERAARIARVSGARIHAYLCIYSSMDTDAPEALREVEMSRYEPWLEEVVGPVRAAGFDVDIQMDWDRDWRNVLGPAARKANSDLIIKSSRRRSAAKRMLMSSSDLALFESAHCPVLLVKSEVNDDHHRFLIAVDISRDGKKYQRRFDAVLAYGRAAAASNDNGELHAVYAYPDPDDYMHVTDVEKRTGLDTAHVHVVGKKPEEAIEQIAEEINANLIVIGVSTKGTLANRVFGNTAEWLLNNLDRDILVVITDDIQENDTSSEQSEALPL